MIARVNFVKTLSAVTSASMIMTSVAKIFMIATRMPSVPTIFPDFLVLVTQAISPTFPTRITEKFLKSRKATPVMVSTVMIRDVTKELISVIQMPFAKVSNQVLATCASVKTALTETVKDAMTSTNAGILSVAKKTLLVSTLKVTYATTDT